MKIILALLLACSLLLANNKSIIKLKKESAFKLIELDSVNYNKALKNLGLKIVYNKDFCFIAKDFKVLSAYMVRDLYDKMRGFINSNFFVNPDDKGIIKGYYTLNANFLGKNFKTIKNDEYLFLSFEELGLELSSFYFFNQSLIRAKINYSLNNKPPKKLLIRASFFTKSTARSYEKSLEILAKEIIENIFAKI